MRQVIFGLTLAVVFGACGMAQAAPFFDFNFADRPFLQRPNRPGHFVGNTVRNVTGTGGGARYHRSR